jgi:predicted PurR-regulated permease PerM
MFTKSRRMMFGWDSRAAKIAWTAGIVALGFYAVYSARKALLILVLAVFFAYMMTPLVRLLERRKWRPHSHIVSVIMAFALVVIIVGTGASLIAPAIVDESQHLLEQLPAKLEEKTSLGSRIPLPQWLEPLRARVDALIQENIRGAAAAAIPFAKSAGTEIIKFFGNLIFVVLIPILAFFFVKDGGSISDTVITWLAPIAPPGELRSMITDVDLALGKYVGALGLLSIATLIAYGTFLIAIGAPYGALLALIAAILEFIPLVGPLTAAVVTLLVAAIDGFGHLLWIAGFIVAYRLVQDYVLYPYLMGGGARVHPVLIIFGLLAGEELGGVAGIFLSVPVISVLLILVRHLENWPAKTGKLPEQPF